MVFGLTGINYGKSHERGSIKRVIEYHGNKVNSDGKVFLDNSEIYENVFGLKPGGLINLIYIYKQSWDAIT